LGPLGNSGTGVGLGGGASENLIGGTEPSARNTISANGAAGIVLAGGGTNQNVVQGNFIGTSADGSAGIPNTPSGIWIVDGASNNRIGGTEPGAGNLVSGNADGVVILAEGGLAPSGNLLEGNLIGTDPTGTTPLPNSGEGVVILDGASQNRIGGTDIGAGNTIAFNGWTGVALSAEAGEGNSVLSNSIFANGGLGIDLGDDGVTKSDMFDSDVGPNGLQNFPIITAITRHGTSLVIHGRVATTPRTYLRLEFFGNEACDPSGFGEGRAYIGFAVVATNPAGHASFMISLPVSIPQGTFVSATATDPAGNTSEFAACAIVSVP